SLISAGGAVRPIFDPLTTDANGVRQPFAGNRIPANRISPIGRAIAATFPSPTQAAAFHGAPNMAYTGQLPSTADQKAAKIDHRFTDWFSANISYLRYSSLEPGETWFPDSISSPEQWRLDRKVDTTQINTTMTLNPTTVLAVRYGYNRFPNYSFQLSQGFDPASLGFNSGFVRAIPSPTFPRVAFQNFYSGTAMGTNSNALVVPNSKNVHGMLSKFVGRHSLKFGADYRLIRVSGADFGNSAGNFTFNDQFTRADFLRGDARSGSDVASLLLGYPADAVGFVPSTLHNFANYTSAFVHDDIRINPNLTINIGLRWERETGLAERNDNLIVGFDRSVLNSISQASGVPTRGAVMFAGQNGARTTVQNPNLNKLSPRLGVAYKLNAKTTIRGGYGIFWAPQTAQGGVYLPEGFTASTQPLTSLDGGRTPNPATSLGTVFSAGLDRPVGSALGDQTGIGKALTIFDPNARSPYVHQFSVDVQRELPFGIALAVAYVGSRSTDLTINSAAININQVEERHFGLGSAGLARAVPNPYFQRGGVAGLAGATVSQA
ncbi:MAG: TonB-dependent receptor, partial [Gemmatimonadales bacterium]|nr:TonB-dependent receptor [Gemmatimonadales bacterium]